MLRINPHWKLSKFLCTIWPNTRAMSVVIPVRVHLTRFAEKMELISFCTPNAAEARKNTNRLGASRYATTPDISSNVPDKKKVGP